VKKRRKSSSGRIRVFSCIRTTADVTRIGIRALAVAIVLVTAPMCALAAVLSAYPQPQLTDISSYYCPH